MYVVLGASGRVGSTVAQSLWRVGAPVRAVVRDAASATGLAQRGCEIAVADLHRPEEVTAALSGASAVHVICPVSPRDAKVPADMSSSSTRRRTVRRVVHVEGPQRYSACDVAAALAEHYGRPITAQVLPRERWLPVLTAAGVSEAYAQLIAATFAASNAGGIDVEPDVGERRQVATPLAAALAAALA